jgi:hypothetical protein
MDDLDAGGHDTFMSALGAGDTAPEPQIDPNPQAGAPEGGRPQGGGQEGGGQQQGEAQPQPEPAPEPQQRQPDTNREPPPGWVPQWRLNEMAAQRREEQRELAELRRFREEQQEAERRQKAEAELQGQNFWEAQDPNAFIDRRFDHRAEQKLSPLEQRLAQLEQQHHEARMEAARYRAESVAGGPEKLHGAWKEVMEAAQQGHPIALALATALDQKDSPQNRDPYLAVLHVHRTITAEREFGSDPVAYRQRVQDEALKDPAFLARAIEASRQQATPVQTGVPGRSPQPSRLPPSLNRETASRDGSGGDESVADVFMNEVARRGRPG